jgi:acyl-CoA thioester hydrolase
MSATGRLQGRLPAQEIVMSFEAPFAQFHAEVEPEWVDHNGHMGIRSYTLVFDRAVSHFYRELGLSRDLLKRHGTSIFALQETSWFKREVLLGDPLLVTSQLIDHDHNKLVTFHKLHQTRDDYVAAMYEIIEIHIDMTARRPTPFPDEIAQHLAQVQDAHASLDRPPESGRGIAIPRKKG